MNMSKWISVEDRLPDTDINVIFICKRHNEICVGERDKYLENMWLDYLQIDSDGDPMDEYEVTHWMPLPEPPTQE